jgi:hypothetical protein
LNKSFVALVKCSQPPAVRFSSVISARLVAQASLSCLHHRPHEFSPTAALNSISVNLLGRPSVEFAAGCYVGEDWDRVGTRDQLASLTSEASFAS